MVLGFTINSAIFLPVIWGLQPTHESWCSEVSEASEAKTTRNSPGSAVFQQQIPRFFCFEEVRLLKQHIIGFCEEQLNNWMLGHIGFSYE